MSELRQQQRASSTSLSSGDSSDPDLRPASPAASSLSALLSAPPSVLRVFLVLVAFRLLNALTVRTFFQPDEFFQSLEPAWQAAFGDNHAPWITWEWRHQLRSSLHPLLFTAVYSTADLLARLLRLSPAWQAELLIAGPKIVQAIIAAVGDLYTWRLACYVYNPLSQEAWAALALTVVSPWQWFCSTRTLSNCLETSLTVAALCQWPWEWSLGPSTTTGSDEPTPKPEINVQTNEEQPDGGILTRFRRCLLLAAVACILRPTNILVWMALAGVMLYQNNWPRRAILVREALLCGSLVLAVSATADRFFYGFWTFPPFRFLYFNLAQSLAVFYGQNDWHYYVSQGLPLLLTTALPFTIMGLYRPLTQPTAGGFNTLQASVQVQLASVCFIMPSALSLISHKELRFIYPLLPSLHVLTAPTLVKFFGPAVNSGSGRYVPRRLIMSFLLLANVFIAFYTTYIHASGPLAVLSYLRGQRQIHGSGNMADPSQPGITAGFLMPCHSTPWRSHLVYPTINAWALSCEPPVGLNTSEKAEYLDEADQFYADPDNFLRANMVGGLRRFPRRPTYNDYRRPRQLPTEYQSTTPHEWPDYLVFFAQLEPTLQNLLRFSAYKECYRTWNTAWHDDWRRRGDIVVWCVDPQEQGSDLQRQRESRDRRFDHILQTIKGSVTGMRKKSAAHPWISIFSGQSRPSSWSWPWQHRRRTTIFGIELPTWMTPSSKTSKWLSSWKLPTWEEWNRRMTDRANWA
ncbi:GPI mannosyltransferase 3 [Aspergillus sclerotiicarbonarius CBS 121057]|uniref:Mannosyltransferase n=1 Tax=Aspergillus sclerotiicarbonarius (strain CBS 121057 / IBT 28362) TaxID=1448318 RepID=A0A319FC25_ASPSB|nr:GPI mannosyltransferase 3 [Aspergillus sclerotiicarbonarius CBS 121057]